MIRRWLADLALGARMAVGRTSLVRLALVATGVGLGVAVLLAATSVPHMLDVRAERGAARAATAEPVAGVDPAYLLARHDEFEGRGLQGYLVQPTGPHGPRAPGVARLPGPGEAVLSPALRDLLASPEGAALRPRFPAEVVGTIGEAGLTGPNELYFYLGSATVAPQPEADVAYRFGGDRSGRDLTALELLLVVLGAATCVIPIVVFVVTSTRLAAVARDRRLAALRLVGADGGQVRRIAAGEALVGAVAGLLVGLGLFAVIRALVPTITLSAFRGGLFSADVQPDWRLGLPALLALPVLAAAVAVLALRRVVIEPLGVVRRGAVPRRRLWWRLLPVVAGTGLLATQFGEDARRPPVVAGIVLLLLAVPALLPWLVDRAAHRLRDGSPAWQLAVRRLQLDSATAARVVSGVAVVLAGAIALQTVYARAEAETPRQPTVRVIASYFATTFAEAQTFADRLHALPGLAGTPVRVSTTVENGAGASLPATVGTCAQLALSPCADGDVFAVDSAIFQAGERARFAGQPDGPQWTLPPVRRIPGDEPELLITPAALHTATGVALFASTTVPDAGPALVEQIRNVVGALGWNGTVASLGTGTDGTYALVTRVIDIGSLVVLLLAAASLVVVALEQMRERRRSLAVLVAGGVPRTVLARALLWQMVIPVGLAVVVAVGVGLTLAALLLALVVNRPVAFDWPTVATLSATAIGVVLLMTALTLPSLWHATSLEQLREE